MLMLKQKCAQFSVEFEQLKVILNIEFHFMLVTLSPKTPLYIFCPKNKQAVDDLLSVFIIISQQTDFNF
jgi:hypothetical protein